MRNRLICIVNNYNYARYLRQCLESALRQAFDRIIVVDDGSDDDSELIIREYASKNGNIVPIIKSNGGQLSCFNLAGKYIEEGDLVFFLDADDVFPANYSAEILRISASEKADFYFCNAVEFTDEEDCPTDARISDEQPLVLPLTSSLTLTRRCWIGSPTSALVISGSLYQQILPYPFERDWVVRADDVIIFAASILGAKKVYIGSLGIGYRIHGNNLFRGNDRWRERPEKLLREFRLDRLFRIYSEKAGVRNKPYYSEVTRELQLMDQDAKAHFRFPSPVKVFRRMLTSRVKLVFRGLFS
jgi:glycosyltransferase involved in cell wall biosynthesis